MGGGNQNNTFNETSRLPRNEMICLKHKSRKKAEREERRRGDKTPAKSSQGRNEEFDGGKEGRKKKIGCLVTEKSEDTFQACHSWLAPHP